jgi:hypothetical protein
MSLWPVIRDLFVRKAAEVVIEEIKEAAQEALSNRDKDKKESDKQSTNQKRTNKK